MLVCVVVPDGTTHPHLYWFNENARKYHNASLYLLRMWVSTGESGILAAAISFSNVFSKWNITESSINLQGKLKPPFQADFKRANREWDDWQEEYVLSVSLTPLVIHWKRKPFLKSMALTPTECASINFSENCLRHAFYQLLSDRWLVFWWDWRWWRGGRRRGRGEFTAISYAKLPSSQKKKTKKGGGSYFQSKWQSLLPRGKGKKENEVDGWKGEGLMIWYLWGTRLWRLHFFPWCTFPGGRR